MSRIPKLTRFNSEALFFFSYDNIFQTSVIFRNETSLLHSSNLFADLATVVVHVVPTTVPMKISRVPGETSRAVDPTIVRTEFLVDHQTTLTRRQTCLCHRFEKGQSSGWLIARDTLFFAREPRHRNTKTIDEKILSESTYRFLWMLLCWFLRYRRVKKNFGGS